MLRRSDHTIADIHAAAYTIPTATAESDGTLEWASTTIVIVTAGGGGMQGLGYTYASPAAAMCINDTLAPVVSGGDVMDVPAAWNAMNAAVRNIGRPGIASYAISAVDAALWDLKAKILGVPLVQLLGAARDATPVYGSGGFTSYAVNELQRQLAGWVQDGIRSVKMKVGRDPATDRARVRAAREAIGAEAGLFVDANGAYTRKQALSSAERYAADGVSWFEEPVSSDDLEGLRVMRDRAPAGMDIAAGEYTHDAAYARRMLAAGAVDVMQADVTRCGGITGFMQIAGVCDAFMIPLSAHTAPSLHLHACCAINRLAHMEWFFDHVRIEAMFFDGAPHPMNGMLRPDLSRPGIGIELKARDIERFAA